MYCAQNTEHHMIQNNKVVTDYLTFTEEFYYNISQSSSGTSQDSTFGGVVHS